MSRNKPWWQNAVIYEIYLKSFRDSDGDGIGDLGGVLEKLPYLKKLGVDAIWLSPFYPGPGMDNGYDISDYGQIDPVYGNLELFEHLIRQAHAQGIRVILDMVVNHSSSEHPWFLESRADKDSPKRDWYIWRDEKNNWGSQFGGSAWNYDAASGQYYLGLFSPYQPDLNWKNPALREEIHQMMRCWAQRGVDGFRLDVISLIAKPERFEDGPLNESGYADWHPAVANNPGAHDYIQELNQEVFSPYGLMTVGEASGVTLEEAIKYSAPERRELDMVFQFEHVGLDGSEEYKWNRRSIPLPELKKTLSKWQLALEGKAWNALFWCNHDQPRIVSRLGATDAYRERSAKMLATCLHFMKGTPYIFQGEELGMTNFSFASPGQLRDIESIQAYKKLVNEECYPSAEILETLSMKSRDNARTPMQWNGTSNAGFTDGHPWLDVNPNYTHINAAEQIGREDSVFHYYRELIRLRHENDCIVHGRYVPIEDNNAAVFAYRRVSKTEELLVLCNFTKEAQPYPLPDTAGGVPLIGNVPESNYRHSGILAPWEAIVLKI